MLTSRQIKKKKLELQLNTMSFNMMKALDKHGVIRITYNTKQLKQHCIQLIISIADNLNYIFFLVLFFISF